jgi:hypothetical protein
LQTSGSWGYFFPPLDFGVIFGSLLLTTLFVGGFGGFGAGFGLSLLILFVLLETQ